MISNISETYITKVQNGLFCELHTLTKTKPLFWQSKAIGISVADVVLETGKPLVKVLDGLIFTIINLVGPFFHMSRHSCVQDALFSLEGSVRALTGIPLSLIVAPIKLSHQLFWTLYDPANATTISQHGTMRDSIGPMDGIYGNRKTTAELA